jgi:hypothetical protein
MIHSIFVWCIPENHLTQFNAVSIMSPIIRRAFAPGLYVSQKTAAAHEIVIGFWML